MGLIGGTVAPFNVFYGLSTDFAVCFISDMFVNIRLYFASVELFISLALILFMYVGVAIYVWVSTRKAKEVIKSEKYEKLKKIFFIGFYPLIYFFIWFPTVAVRFDQTVKSKFDNVPYTTQLWVTGLLPWNGFINGIWYGFSRQIFSALKGYFFGKISPSSQSSQ